MKQKIRFLLATIMMLVALATQATTITWDSSVIGNIYLFEVNGSYNNSGITVQMTAMDAGGFYGSSMMSEGQPPSYSVLPWATSRKSSSLLKMLTISMMIGALAVTKLR